MRQISPPRCQECNQRMDDALELQGRKTRVVDIRLLDRHGPAQCLWPKMPQRNGRRWATTILLVGIGLSMVTTAGQASATGTGTTSGTAPAVLSLIAPTRIVTNQPIGFTAVALPHVAGRLVYLQAKSGSGWVDVAFAKTNKFGRVTLQLPTAYIGSRHLRALAVATRIKGRLYHRATSKSVDLTSSKIAVALIATRVTLARSGGKIVLKGTVTNGLTCQWTISPEVARFDTTTPCKAHLSKALVLPKNTSKKSKSYVVTLVVAHGKQRATHQTRITVTTLAKIVTPNETPQSQTTIPSSPTTVPPNASTTTTTPIGTQSVFGQPASGKAVSLAVGGLASCAVLDSGRIACWGYNMFGWLGDGGYMNAHGNEVYSSTPVFVADITNAKSITGSHEGYSFCALLGDGGISCWGDNGFGALGAGYSYEQMGYSTTPVPVIGISSAQQIASNGIGHGYCSVLSDHRVECWGDNSLGQLGDGGAESFSDTPVFVAGVSNARLLVGDGTGSGYCALLETNQISCWGNNSNGQLGNGSSISGSSTPVLVSGINNATNLATTNVGTGYCATLTSGLVSCWGAGATATVAGTFAPVRSPISISGISSAIQVLGEETASCAIIGAGSVKCWGSNVIDAIDPLNPRLGRLGDGGTEKFSATPVSVVGITNAIQLSSAAGTAKGFCSVLASGRIECWGDNTYGDLGIGNQISSSNIPVQVGGISDAVAMDGRTGVYCALLSSGGVSCWGNDDYGSVGDGGSGAFHFVYTPATVVGLG